MTEGQSLYRIEEHPGYVVLSFSPGMSDAQMGTVDSVGADVLSRLEPMPTPAIIVDLSPLKYMGSAMVALIVRIWKAVNGRNGRMVVVNDNGIVQEVLRIAGLEKVWTIVPTREEAVRELGVRSKPVHGQEERTTGLVLLGLGVLALAGALAGLVLLLGRAQALSDRTAFLLTVICAVLGIILGGVAAFREVGTRRVLAGLLAAASLVVLVIGVVRSPAAVAADPPPEAALNAASAE